VKKQKRHVAYTSESTESNCVSTDVDSYATALSKEKMLLKHH
jgi:hypothetical protein